MRWPWQKKKEEVLPDVSVYLDFYACNAGMNLKMSIYPMLSREEIVGLLDRAVEAIINAEHVDDESDYSVEYKAGKGHLTLIKGQGNGKS